MDGLSGRVDRFQIIYQVPEKVLVKDKDSQISDRVKDEDGSVEQINCGGMVRNPISGKHQRLTAIDGWKIDLKDLEIERAPLP
ncbi:MAG: hypothetical protein CM15mV65_370 [Caudoviricetes sp.]|nr:MAG: hypothetical protein CM15mV65_370 [Caudoviricetes sp.]